MAKCNSDFAPSLKKRQKTSTCIQENANNLTSLQKSLKKRRQKFDFSRSTFAYKLWMEISVLPDHVPLKDRINSSFPFALRSPRSLIWLCLGSEDMYVARLCRELRCSVSSA